MSQSEKIKVFMFANGCIMTEAAILKDYACLAGSPVDGSDGKPGVIKELLGVHNNNGALYLLVNIECEGKPIQAAYIRAPRMRSGMLTGIKQPLVDC